MRLIPWTLRSSSEHVFFLHADWIRVCVFPSCLSIHKIFSSLAEMSSQPTRLATLPLSFSPMATFTVSLSSSTSASLTFFKHKISWSQQTCLPLHSGSRQRGDPIRSLHSKSSLSHAVSKTAHPGALTIRPPTKRPRDTSTQVQFTHGPPPGSSNKRFVVAGGSLGC